MSSSSDIIQKIATKAFFEAIRVNDVQKVEKFLKAGFSVNSKHAFGETPLDCAAIEDNYTISKLLIKNGADINIKDKFGNAVIQNAIKCNSTRVMDVLLENKVKTDVLNIYDQTLLHIATLYRRVDIVERLIKQNMDVNAQDIFGKTPLHHAIKKYAEQYNVLNTDNHTIVLLLLENGAKTDIVDKYNQTPVSIATKLKKTTAIKILKQHIDNEETKSL